jgi:hypothetical protein
VMTDNHAVGEDGWTARFVNNATGRAQAKVFSVCVARDSEVVNGHQHQLVTSDQQSETRSLPTGRTDVTLTCDTGQVPVQPGWALDDAAPVVTSYPNGERGWTFAVDNAGGASAGTFTLRCLDVLTSEADGHQHELGFDEVRQSVTVQPGQVSEITLSCASDAKGIVAGYDVDPGLVVLGNDPRPVIRVFKLFNPTDQPLDADLYLHCLANRTEKGADAGGTVTNTATVSTSTAETTTDDNSSSVAFQVDTSPVSPVSPVVPHNPVAPAAPSSVRLVAVKALVSKSAVATTVSCTGAEDCAGRAQLVASKRMKVNGHVVKKGTVLATVTYSVEAGTKAKLKLVKTKAGRTALRGKAVRKVTLRIGGKAFTVSLRR